MYNRQPLGEILMQLGKLEPAGLQRGLKMQAEKGGRIGEVLRELELVSDEDVAMALSRQLDYPYEPKIEADAIDLMLLERLQLGWARDHGVLPFDMRRGHVLVATDDPLAVEVLDEVRFLTGMEALPVVVPTGALQEAINKAFDRKSRQLGAGLDELDEAENPHAEEASLDINDLLDAGDDDEAPVIRFVNSLFVQSVRERASDIHIEAGDKEITVRFRIDGVLKEVASPPKRFHSSIITRIKIMAGLNIAEKRLPQDGRIRIKMAGKDIDIRVATAPAVHGERITMRLLDKSAVLLNLRDIGMAEDHLRDMMRLIFRPHGIVLVTGPTGSGKTTTLYSALSEINSPDKNILTIEDPVEYQLEGISQMQVNPKIQLTFAAGLRSYLRHDPDVIMVGEIRDVETAEMAIQASLTGHLVFSTLHTNDAAGAFTRLTDMGVEPFLVSSTVICSLAQRLVRRLCGECKVAYQPTAEELAEVGLTPAVVAERTGGHLFKPGEDSECPNCLGLGYKGRMGIYEIMRVEDEVRRLVMNRADAGSIKKEAARQGMRSLRDDGALKILAGSTTIEEVMRVTQEDFAEA
ncbi:type II secretion system protein GspE [Bradymonadaceae bacterium TMQ3]|uniref:protein-secreting ATPase n=1 Tax=Lujinxingia sediminis TaxID=2480984 RepID=A0ABY0CTW5_9DELT|nr:type II secretion system ATPase GspE [Lujinxingia sediminis]RDV38554.1 type II secretion system protein GspE [Bradymonadaceae bacterium TMQ3]RVU44898.1 type II secretion system protein GspE [Lujinxingia sediminis]TXC76677.1 type II secretion system protein GspE [Bradymonadales bacterium TMQ1]